MHFQRNEKLEDDLLRDLLSGFEDDEPRPVVSVTSLIYCLTKTYWQEHLLHEPDRGAKLLFLTGHGFERALLIGKQVADAGELDGIAYHIDSYKPDELYEVKSTRTSVNRRKVDGGGEHTPETINEQWLRQIRSYCYIKGTRSAKLAVIHLMGNYSPPFPDLRVWDITFTQEELDSNWEWLLERAAAYQVFGERKKPPTPFEFLGYEGECREGQQGECPFLMLCKVKSEA